MRGRKGTNRKGRGREGKKMEVYPGVISKRRL